MTTAQTSRGGAYRQIAGIMPHAFRCDVAPHRESCGAVGLVTLHDAVTPGHWHVVNDPLLHVVLVDAVVQKTQFLHVSFLGIIFSRSCVVPIAEEDTVFHCFTKVDLDRE